MLTCGAVCGKILVSRGGQPHRVGSGISEGEPVLSKLCKPTNPADRLFQNKFGKPLDKSLRVWYNKRVKRDDMKMNPRCRPRSKARFGVEKNSKKFEIPSWQNFKDVIQLKYHMGRKPPPQPSKKSQEKRKKFLTNSKSCDTIRM